MAGPVFISHSSRDVKAARAICDAIETRGVACWISGRDVGPGENFGDAIVEAIERAPAMVLVFSSNANNSEEIKKELALASQHRVAVIPVRVEDITPSQAFRYELATRQWIDMFVDWDQALKRLTDKIVAIRTAAGQGGPPPAPSPRPETTRAAGAGRIGALAAVAAAFVAVAAAGGFFWLRASGGDPSASTLTAGRAVGEAPATTVAAAPADLTRLPVRAAGSQQAAAKPALTIQGVSPAPVAAPKPIVTASLAPASSPPPAAAEPATREATSAAAPAAAPVAAPPPASTAASASPPPPAADAVSPRQPAVDAPPSPPASPSEPKLSPTPVADADAQSKPVVAVTAPAPDRIVAASPASAPLAPASPAAPLSSPPAAVDPAPPAQSAIGAPPSSPGSSSAPAPTSRDAAAAPAPDEMVAAPASTPAPSQPAAPPEAAKAQEKAAVAVAALEPAVAPAKPAAVGAAGVKSFRDCEDCPEMVVIPRGAALIGSPRQEASRMPNEPAPSEAAIPAPLAVGRYDVTFDEWDACVAAGGCNNWNPGDFGWGRGRQPVIFVSWSDAEAYVAWLRQKTGKPYRLLSETEWEYAARGCATTACPNQPFWFGAITPEIANYDSRYAYLGSPKGLARRRAVPVDEGASNPFGLVNMLGNVRQWVEDCWSANPGPPPAAGAPRTDGDCASRVTRGGSFSDKPQDLRAAARSWETADARSQKIGFRVARALDP